MLSLNPELPSSGDERGAHLYKWKCPLQEENVCPVFRAFPMSAGSQWPLAQKNPCAKEAYLGEWHVLESFRVKVGRLEQECFTGEEAASAEAGAETSCWRCSEKARGDWREAREGSQVSAPSTPLCTYTAPP